jgi:hypothetical protein
MLEGFSDSQLFKPSKHENGFKLFKIKKWLWKLLMQFSWTFDHGDGNSQWHIFDGRSNMFNVYTECDTERFNAGHHVTLYSENVEHSLYDSGDEVWVTWVPPHLNFEKEKSLPVFSDRKSWNASFTYCWLIEEFIPYVIYYDSLRYGGFLNFLKRNLSCIQRVDKILYQDFLGKFNPGEYITDGSVKYNSIEIDKINTSSDLLQNAHKLQLFFTMQPEIVPVGIEHLSKLLESLCICICHSSSDDWSYVCEKLSFVNSCKKENIIQDIQDFRKSHAEKYIRSYILDDIFRSFIHALKTSRINKDEIKTIIDSWNPFIEFYQENILVQRYNNGVLVGD